MKKNNVSIDIISFGTSSTSATSLPPLLGPSTSSLPLPEIESNQTKLESLHEAVNSTENTSHILFVEPGLHLLSEKISSSAILRGEDVGESGGEERDGEVDGNLDPELAMVSPPSPSFLPFHPSFLPCFIGGSRADNSFVGTTNVSRGRTSSTRRSRRRYRPRRVHSSRRSHHHRLGVHHPRPSRPPHDARTIKW